MNRREKAAKPDAEETEGVWTPKVAPTPRKTPLIATWLSEFEEKIARDFNRRTGIGLQTDHRPDHRRRRSVPGMQVLDVPTGTGVIARQFVGKIGEKAGSPAGTYRAKNSEKRGWRRIRRKSPCASSGGK